MCLFLCLFFFFFSDPYSASVRWNTQDFQCSPGNVNSSLTNQLCSIIIKTETKCHCWTSDYLFCGGQKNNNNTLPSNVTGRSTSPLRPNGQFCIEILIKWSDYNKYLGVKLLSPAEYFFKLRRATLSLKPGGRHGRKRRIRHASVLLAGPTECDRRWCCSQSEGGGEGAADSGTSAPPGRQSCACYSGRERCGVPGATLVLDAATRNATASGWWCCSWRDSTRGVKKKKKKKSGFDPNL